MIYFFHDERVPVFLLTVFAKNERVDLTQAEKNRMKQLTTQLVESYGQGRGTKK